MKRPSALLFGIAVCGVLLSSPALLHAQGAGGAAQDQPVEIIGLHRWTRQMIKDSLAKNVPGSDTTLSTHACGAEILQLGFIRTAAIYYPTRILVSVVEPQDSALVRNNVPASTTRTLPAAWNNVLNLYLGEDGKFANQLLPLGIKIYPMIKAGKADSLRAVIQESGDVIPPALDSLWAFVSRTSEADRVLALDVLQHDSLLTHRTMAIAVLANYPQRDDSWHALLHVLRDRNDIPGLWQTAQTLLDQWANTATPRTVNWSRSPDDIRALLAGANLWALPNIMRILTRTRIDPALASAVLANNDVFVRGYAASHDRQAAKIGQDLLTQLNATR